jgi:hypothetical protein
LKLSFGESLAGTPDHVIAAKVKRLATSRGFSLSDRLIRKISRVVGREEPPFVVRITKKGKIVIEPGKEVDF